MAYAARATGALLRDCQQVRWLPLQSITLAQDIDRWMFPVGEEAGPPLTVRMIGQNSYRVLTGQERFLALRQSGRTHVDAIVLSERGLQTTLRRLMELRAAGRLPYLEEAEAYRSILSHYGIQEAELAARVGQTRAYVAAKLRLLALDAALRREIIAAELPERVARGLLRLPSASARARVVRATADGGLSPREAEALIDDALTRLPVPLPRSPRRISLMRDHRLYLNAVRSIVDQMRDAGVPVDCAVAETRAVVSIHIVVPKKAM